MWFETTYDGLGDCASDVSAGLRSDYVYAGSVLRYECEVSTRGMHVPYTFQQSIVGAIAARGYRNVSVDGPTTGLWTLGVGNVTATVTAPIDQASKEDVKANIDGAINSIAGIGVDRSSISFHSRPTAADICSGAAASGAQGQVPAAGDRPGGERESTDRKPDKCAGTEGLNWLACQAGVETKTLTYLGIGAIALIAVTVVMGGRR